jgi:uncharacterized protein
MFINVSQIDPDGLQVDCQVRPRPLSSPDGRLIPFDPVTLKGALSPRSGGYRFQGVLSGKGTLECSRCLEPFGQEIRVEFDLFYSEIPPKTGPAHSNEAVEEAEMYSPLVGKQIDLSALVSEQIYLNLPLKPLCAPACRGLCPNCGVNRNLAGCECEDAEQDPTVLAPSPERQNGKQS